MTNRMKWHRLIPQLGNVGSHLLFAAEEMRLGVCSSLPQHRLAASWQALAGWLLVGKPREAPGQQRRALGLLCFDAFKEEDALGAAHPLVNETPRRC